jgi:hypothetical protein
VSVLKGISTLYSGFALNFRLYILRKPIELGPLLIVLLCTAVGVFLASYLYSIDDRFLLYYGDSVSHLVRAREIVESPSPGPQQIGTVWLPLPHLLLLPFSLVNSLFTTGFAGTLVSLPSTAIAAAILYKMIRADSGILWIAVVGGCLYFSNPNIVYLGLTAMTEAPFMLFFVVSAYYFQRCFFPAQTLSYSRKRQANKNFRAVGHFYFFSIVGFQDKTGYKYKISDTMNLFRCSLFIALATLCRYEAWPIPMFLLVLLTISFVRVIKTIEEIENPAYFATRKSLTFILISCTLLSFSGVIIWISYNMVYYGNPLEFIDAPYYSAVYQALEGQYREIFYLQPANVSAIYLYTALAFYGPFILLGAAGGYVVQRRLRIRKEDHRRDLIYSFLAIPSAASLLTLLIGIGEMNFWWYNSRFLIMLSPLLTMLVGTSLKGVAAAVFSKGKIIFVCTIIFLVFLHPLIVMPLTQEIVTLIDAKNSISYGTRPAAMEMARHLGNIYDGGKVMLVTGSPQQNIIMQLSGIPLINFYTANKFDTAPGSFPNVKYVILSKSPDPNLQSVAKTWHDWFESTGFLRNYFEQNFENSYYEFFIRSKW